MLKRITARVGIIALAGAAALALVIAPVHSTPAHANPTSGFKPGNIIADSLFYNGNAMSASQTQSFLNKRMPNPSSQSLRNYKQRTTSKSSSAYCAAYAGKSSETAAQIIHKVGKACGISQKALVVMLEKETSLVGMRSPQNWRYDRAMGYACPDTGPGGSANCDTSYYGFFNQVWNGARQLKRYGMDSYFGWFPVGKTTNIQYHPNKACGTKSVRIVNKATAALHYYTPYTPNQAALNAGWGTGNSCSSYGNRNFYSFYTAWFGGTNGISVNGDIRKYWDARGGQASDYGIPVLKHAFYATRFDNGLWFQQFAGGIITTEMNTGKTAGIPFGPVFTHYNGQAGGIRGALGAPISEPTEYTTSGGGSLQWFQGGFIASSSAARTTTSMSYGPVYDLYNNVAGGIYGELGYPTAMWQAYPGGELQNFQRGIIAQATGQKHPVYMEPGPLYDHYNGTAGGIKGRLGYPVSNAEELSDGTLRQEFQKGFLIITTNGTVVEVSGADFSAYSEAAKQGTPLGTPTGPKRSYSANGGAELISFENGLIITEKTTQKTSFIAGMPLVHYNEVLGGIYGEYGYPTSNPRTYAANGKGTLQEFQEGLILVSEQAGSVAGMREDSAVYQSYNQNHGGIFGWLGYPVADERVGAHGSRSQQFQNGIIAIDASGNISALPLASAEQYELLDGAIGGLGKQTEAPRYYSEKSGAWLSFFENGMIFENSMTGEAASMVYSSQIYEYYNNRAGGIYGDFGYPIDEETTQGGVTSQLFQGGKLSLQDGVIVEDLSSAG